MKIADIYALKPIHVSHELDMFISAAKAILADNVDAAMPMLQSAVKIWEYSHEFEHLIDTSRWAIHTYMDEQTDDSKYGARLFAVFFDNKPIMLVKNNGRYFSDYKPYVTDKDQLNNFAEYLLSLSNHFEATEELVVFSADEDIEDIDKIDQYNLFDYYSVTFTPKYQVDDIVWAWVPENHLKGNWIKDFKGYVLTKVQIKSATPLNPIRSYFGTQLERDWNFSDRAIDFIEKYDHLRLISPLLRAFLYFLSMM